ncbi:DUF7507 domain-containing protein, partial [Aerolutibacter daejeonensis]|uniref:DUF7507 domain-containing protein n=1 Tax=Aerolutibacter daejeonensis TaxID=346181 RepID=UPI0018DDDFC5
VNAGSVTNVATASAIFNNAAVNSAQDSATVTATQTASMSLEKTASPLVYAAAGDVISYSYLLTNTGNVTLSAPYTVADDKTTVTCPATPGTLAPGGTVTCTATYTITQTDVNAGSVTNVATASSNFNGAPVTSNQDDATVTATRTPVLTLDKRLVSGAGFDSVGDVIQYAYDVTNSGNVTITGPITVSDDKIASVTCPAGDLAPGAMVTCTASYTVTQADINTGSVTNIATAAGSFNNQPVTSNPDTVTVEALQEPALTLAKAAVSGDPYDSVGDVVQYEYLVTNSGNVVITDPITVADDKTTVTCPALPGGGLAPGGSITCTASYTITQADVDAGSVTNLATATSGTVNSNQATETVNATRSPSLGLEKTASPLVYAAAGDVISYSYLLTNTGNVTLSAPYTVADDKTTVTCPATPGTLAPGGTVTCTATYTITQTDVNAGSVTNVATASAIFNNAAVNSAQDSATVTATQTPTLS